jgi:hypothetical protein
MPPLPKYLDHYIGDRPLLWADIQVKREVSTDDADIIEDVDLLHLNDVLVHGNIDIGERTAFAEPEISTANGGHRPAIEVPALG